MKPQLNNSKIKLNVNGSYKIGMNEVVGLETTLRDVLRPVLDRLNEMESWSGDGWFEMESAEYKSRDGFIPHSHNHGGIIIGAVIPKCGQYNFDFLEFGECDECGKAEEYPEGDHQCGYKGVECAAEGDGHLDAYLRLWLKFEGINEDGELEFYLNLSGGNGDAPYFRVKHLSDIFEASFTCKSVAGIKRAASKHIKALLEVLS